MVGHDADGIEIEVQRDNGIVVVRVTGVVDMTTAPILTTEVDAVLTDLPSALIVDLTGVEFLSSAGLETLIHAYNTAGDRTAVAVVADGPATSRPITVTGIDRTIPLYRTLTEALAQMQR